MTEDKNDASEFIIKLRDMMNLYSDIIGWNEECNEIVIKNLRRMTEEVLPKYFRHSKFESFVRQLNMYNFHKVCREKNNTINFKNEHFFKGNESNFCKIRRKKKTDSRNRNPDLLEENIRFFEEYPNLDDKIQKLIIMLLNFKNLSHSQNRKGSQLIQRIAEEFKGSKYKKLEPAISELRASIQETDEKAEEIQQLINSMKIPVKVNVTDEDVKKSVDIGTIQSTINSYLENTPITSTILEPFKVKKIEVEHFKSTFNLHSFRSITSFIDVCRPVKEEDVAAKSEFSLDLNERDKDFQAS